MTDRELDVLVAEKVMGWAGDKANATHNFSTDIAAAWTVVESLRARRAINGLACDLCIKVGIGDDDHCFCDIFDLSSAGYVGQSETISGRSTALTPGRAICLAALDAVDAIDPSATMEVGDPWRPEKRRRPRGSQ